VKKLEISKVHDAYERDGECPLCDLEEAAEQAYLRSFEHSRAMEPQVRVQTNREGFCEEHLRKLYAGENKLGVGLVLHTRLQRLREELDAALRDPGRGAGRRGSARRMAGAARRIQALGGSCYLCRMLSRDRRRYAFTILYLWSRDPGFPPVFRASRGFCIPHFAAVLQEGLSAMRADRLQRWLAEAGPLMQDSLRRLEGELLSFTQLHRAENRSLGTEEERTALARAVQKLGGGLPG
jgi:hypothetical protein